MANREFQRKEMIQSVIADTKAKLNREKARVRRDEVVMDGVDFDRAVLTPFDLPQYMSNDSNNSAHQGQLAIFIDNSFGK